MIAPGQIVGHRYRIQDLVGTGGMSHVYRAINLATRRVVAIKVLKEEYINDAEFLRRFEREARAVLHLSHDNIVRAYDVGEADGLPYIVMEYVEGQTLKQIVTENGPMPARLAVSMMLQVLDALSAAHDAGIIHRDVKPQNVIVTPTGKCMLMDFGIAREANASTITFAGNTILGSVHYLSPEQAKGKPVTEGSDLYSAGVMLYELLTGSVPFDGENSVAIALMHINDQPVPPIRRNPKIPVSLNDVIMRALNKNLDERYATALEMSRHLKRTLTEPDGDFARTYRPEATLQLHQPQGKRKKKRKRVHGALKIAAAVAAIILAFVGIFIFARDMLGSDSATMEIVPVLVSRSLDDARERAEDYGFSLEVREHEVNDAVPYNHVILQTPESGTKAKRGATITVTVSLGPTVPLMPDLAGLTPDEAKRALSDAGLVQGSVQYRVSDVEIGYVCAQSILPNSEVSPGTVVDLWISATSETTFPMPSVADEVLNLAFARLSELQFSQVFVRFDPQSDQEDGLVLTQEPAAESDVLADTPVTITVSGPQTRACRCDAAFNLDITENATQVMAAVQESANGFAYYRILSEATLEKGERVPFTFTAYSDTEGAQELVLFVNGVELRRQSVAFSTVQNG